MNVTFLTDVAATKTILALVKACKRVDVAVAWAGQNEVVSALWQHRAKLGKLVIGTHLYHTDPAVLRKFMKVPDARCMPPTGDLFHPKVYLFELPSGSAAVIGSHNLTKGAFGGGNIEASVLLKGKAGDQALKALADFVSDCWGEAEAIDDDFLFPYEIQYEANKARQRALQRFHRFKRPRPGTAQPSPLTLSWADFVAGVLDDTHHSLDGRLEVLQRAAQVFNERQQFANMTPDERKAIAGTYGRVEPRLDNLDWGWFGNMFGMGDFKNLVNHSPDGLSDALDQIAAEGNVDQAQYKAFIKRFKAAFVGKTRQGGIATASRLLAMKRPDVFVAMNDGNKPGLCNAAGFPAYLLTLDNYWERIVVPIRTGPWWRHPRPRHEPEDRIWDNRAALLDSIYYVPP